MKLSKGRIVMAGIEPTMNNGDDTCPAIITRVWSDTMVNIRLFPDGISCPVKTSVRLYENEDDARQGGIGNACFWPARV
jgi:hypothetical protein